MAWSFGRISSANPAGFFKQTSNIGRVAQPLDAAALQFEADLTAGELVVDGRAADTEQNGDLSGLEPFAHAEALLKLGPNLGPVIGHLAECSLFALHGSYRLFAPKAIIGRRSGKMSA